MSHTSASTLWLWSPSWVWLYEALLWIFWNWLLWLNIPFYLTGFEWIFWETLNLSLTLEFISALLVLTVAPLNRSSLIYGCQCDTLFQTLFSFLFSFPVLLQNNWHTSLYQLKTCRTMVWFIYLKKWLPQ